ncbi:MAG: bifunctional oligoribonuclease/PAP phosphatase NrnA [Bacillota bacterium]|nr:bifunctional oligoribonuclease/PAP phosphatase NrnA [Bacillota bacterium]MDW7682530.1 bifunctional oligoribonuclease/PAP phosphatase NrnA [Bacillota bacterium]
MNSLKEIAARLQQSRAVLLTAHIMPDGDSIGSILGLGLPLRKAGYRVTMFSADEVPARYRFLAGAEDIITGSFPQGDYDCIVALDCSDHLRIRPVWERVSEYFLINIDHHPTNQKYGQMNLVDPRAAATGEIVFDLLAKMGLPVDTDTAAALYVAISTDTGSFKYENTTPKTHRVVADLLHAGVKLAEITPRVFDMRTRTAVCALREALASLQFSEDGKIAWITLGSEEMGRCGAKDEDLDGVVNYAKNIEGVEVGILLREKDDGTVKVGLRSRSVDVAKVAESLGGGGHVRAAGCSLEMKLREAEQAVLAAVGREV